MKRHEELILTLLLCLLAACSNTPKNPQLTDKQPVIYPDNTGRHRTAQFQYGRHPF